jgi:endoglucanase
MARRCAAIVGITFAALILASAPASAAEQEPPGVALTGVNLAGAEFNAGKTLGRPFFDYVYPNEREIAYFAGKGANVIRLPVLWERLQPKLNSPLDRGELDRLRATIGLAKRSDLSVVIDIHNFGGYRGQKVGSADVPVDAFADLWSRLALEFPSDNRIIFGLMNEPIAMDGPTLRAAANGAIAAIRAAGAHNLVLVPGVGWSGAHDFVPNSGTALLDIRDPGRNFAYEAHQYLDADNSGTHWDCVDAKAARGRMTAMTAWLRLHKRQGFLGEFGAASDPSCL